MPVSISMSRFTSQTGCALQRIGDGQILAHLYGLDVLENGGQRQSHVGVAKAFVHLKPRCLALLVRPGSMR